MVPVQVDGEVKDFVHNWFSLVFTHPKTGNVTKVRTNTGLVVLIDDGDFVLCQIAPEIVVKVKKSDFKW